MKTDKIFTVSLIFSFLVHIMFLCKLSFSLSANNVIVAEPRKLEVVYCNVVKNYKIKRKTRITGKVDSKSVIKKEEVELKRTKKVKKPKSVKRKRFTKKKGSIEKKEIYKQTVTPNTPKEKAKISKDKQITPTLDKDLKNKHNFLNYYQSIREKIKEKVFLNYKNHYLKGDIYVNFTLKSDGSLLNARIINSISSNYKYLRVIAIDSVKQAAPFNPFPENFKRNKISINVPILFE